MTEPHREKWAGGHSVSDWGARPARIIPVPNLTANELLISGRGVLHGWSLFAASSGVLDYIMYDGMDANGTPITQGSVTNATTDRQSLGTAGVELVSGLFIAISSGQAFGSVWVAYDEPRDDERRGKMSRDRVAAVGGVR